MNIEINMNSLIGQIKSDPQTALYWISILVFDL